MIDAKDCLHAIQVLPVFGDTQRRLNVSSSSCKGNVYVDVIQNEFGSLSYANEIGEDFSRTPDEQNRLNSYH